MAEYIKREALKTEFKRLKLGENSFIERVFADGVYAIIEQFPAADVSPVVHGQWEMRPTGMATDTDPEYKAYCTVCNEPNKQYQPPFWPHCGAKMDGGADHEAD